MSADVVTRMREDWNARAKEDAHYYVAFGRRDQEGDEFFATGHDQVRGFELELKRLPPSPPRARRALEIGCGPGRLMRPLSRNFGEIHGVDIADEMIARARENLRGIPHAHPHHAPNSNLEAFANSSFDFVYSYAVFQHIPSRDVVMGYLWEAARVLKPGGILRAQISGLPEHAQRCDTWSGVRIPAADVAAFAREASLQLLALEGKDTQYMWTTLRKPAGSAGPAGSIRIRRITNAHSSEPVAPTRGRFSALALWVEGLPVEADLNHLAVTCGGKPSFLTYLGPPEADGMRQLNLLLPANLGSGLADLHLFGDSQLAARAFVRLITPPPAVPRVVSVTDGIDLLSGARIVSGSVKITTEEVTDPSSLRAWVNAEEVQGVEHFCTDPRLPSHEFNFPVPAGAPGGAAVIGVALAGRALGSFPVELPFTVASR